MNQTILVVDDDPALREFLKISLESRGYEALEAAHGTSALELTRKHDPDALLLDLGLPDMSGLEVIRHLRDYMSTPILVISVEDAEEVVVQALDGGADDYLTKPFRLSELLARLRAALRRQPHLLKTAPLQCGPLCLDPESREVKVSDHSVSLTPNEFSILKILVENQGRVVTHKHLLRAVWGEAYLEETQLLRVHVSNLRRKLEAFQELAHYLRNEPSIGYRLSPP